MTIKLKSVTEWQSNLKDSDYSHKFFNIFSFLFIRSSLGNSKLKYWVLDSCIGLQLTFHYKPSYVV